MVRKQEVELYSFSELSKEAKQKVIERFRDINTNFDWWEPMEEGFKETMKGLGYNIAKVYFSGFYSQGDGASFTGTVNVKDWLKSHNLSNKYKQLYNFTDAVVYIKQSGYYSHSGTMTIDSELYDASEKVQNQMNEVENLIQEEARQKADEYYRNLQDYYEELTSDKAVIETIEINEYEFTKTGASLPSYHSGGIVKNTGLAELHKGELVIPKTILNKLIKTNNTGKRFIIGKSSPKPKRSQTGKGWHKESKRHSLAARGIKTKRKRYTLNIRR